MENKSQIMREITPLSERDCFYVADRRKAAFDYPVHCHREYELNFTEHATGARRIVGDSEEVVGDYDLVLYAISEFGNIPRLSDFWADGQYWSFMIPWWDNARTGDPNSEAFKSTDHNNANIDYWQDALLQDCAITRDELPNFR